MSENRIELDEEDWDTVALLDDSIIGLTQELIDKLEAIGIATVSDLIRTDLERTVKAIRDGGFEITDDAFKKIVNSVKEATRRSIPRSANEVLEMWKIRNSRERTITTGSEELDASLGGRGYMLGTTVEVFGSSNNAISGRTDLALQLAVNVFLSSGKGGVATSSYTPQVLYIDANRAIETIVAKIPIMCDKISEVMKHSPVEKKIFLDVVTENIFVKGAESASSQESVVEEAYKEVIEGKKSYTVVIVDGLLNNFDVGDVDRKTALKRARAINSHIKKLKSVAMLSKTPDDLGGILFCTNVITRKGDELGGNVVKNNFDTRFKLRNMGSRRQAELVDCSFMPLTKSIFTVHDWGIGGEDGVPSSVKINR